MDATLDGLIELRFPFILSWLSLAHNYHELEHELVLVLVGRNKRSVEREMSKLMILEPRARSRTTRSH